MRLQVRVLHAMVWSVGRAGSLQRIANPSPPKSDTQVRILHAPVPDGVVEWSKAAGCNPVFRRFESGRHLVHKPAWWNGRHACLRNMYFGMRVQVSLRVSQAGIAQLAVRLIRNQQVMGSSLIAGFLKQQIIEICCFFCVKKPGIRWTWMYVESSFVCIAKSILPEPDQNRKFLHINMRKMRQKNRKEKEKYAEKYRTICQRMVRNKNA